MNILLLCLAGFALLSHPVQPATEAATMHATGTFDVKVTPQVADNPPAQASGIGRLSLDKQFHGALEATGQGEMLASGDGAQSGAYVAIEKVTGSLQGRSGSFVLVHSAVLVQGVPQDWTVKVVPDSGTEQLRGLAGAMQITIADGEHSYDFRYSLPE
ncbi:DUF3224 domain-containing protein [Luteimonas sp. B3_2_R+30]|uniref:DUF3224 domain-containing protein n=2 Tax=Luteimonas salinilitoris TaxID=3237697 RepID=A0ABV4HU02_9GAMM